MAVEGGECAGVVHGDDVEDDGGVGRVEVVAVGRPATGEEVDFDAAAEVVPAGIEDGVSEIGASGAAGHAREDDAQGAPVFEAEGAGVLGGPARGHVAFARGQRSEGRRRHGRRSEPAPYGASLSARKARRRALAPRGR